MAETSAVNGTSNNAYGYSRPKQEQQSIIEQRKSEGLRTDRVSLSYETVNRGNGPEKAAGESRDNQSVVFRRMEEAAKKEATGDYARLSPGELFSTIA